MQALAHYLHKMATENTVFILLNDLTHESNPRSFFYDHFKVE